MNINLVSRRIKLEIFTKDKVNSIYQNWLLDEEINEFIKKSNLNTINSLKKFVERLSPPTNFFFRIIDIKSNKHIGNVRVGPLSFKNKSSGFGIMIGNKKFHNKGYGKEVTRLSIYFLFKFLKFKKIQFDCYTNNKPAMKLYESLGFNKKIKSSKLTLFFMKNED